MHCLFECVLKQVIIHLLRTHKKQGARNVNFLENFAYVLNEWSLSDTTEKMKFSIKDFFSKYDQIRSFLRIWSYLLKKSLMENFIFCAIRYPRIFPKFHARQFFYSMNLVGLIL